jgi:DNA mismatch repair ATPase MutL
MDASIRRLDNETSWAMQATVRVTSLHNAVEEVILNSLAAGCQRVDVLVDFDSHAFEVIDDGT